MTSATHTSATAATTGRTSDPRPYIRIAAALRRAISGGAILPGTWLDQADIAPRFHAPASAAIKAFSLLRSERLVIWHEYRWFAAPAGPPDSAASARLGATLTQLRTAVGKTPEELAGTIPARPRGLAVFAGHIRAAEAGTWQPRHFWVGCDTALGADGTLLRLHDNSFARVGASGSSDPGQDDATEYLPPPPPPPGLHPDAARVASEISGRVAAGHWPPGTPLPTQAKLSGEHSASPVFVGQALRELAGQGILIRVPRIGYLTLGSHQAPARTVTAVTVILEWDDGTCTRLTCTPAHQPPAPSRSPS